MLSIYGYECVRRHSGYLTRVVHAVVHSPRKGCIWVRHLNVYYVSLYLTPSDLIKVC